MNADIRKRLRHGQFAGIEFMYAFWNAIYRKEFLDGHGVEFPLLSNGEDIVFLTKALYHANRVSLFDDAVYYYYQHPASLSRNLSQRYFDSIFKHIALLTEFMASTRLSKQDRIDFFQHAVLDTLVNHHLTYLKSSQLYPSYLPSYLKSAQDVLNGFEYARDLVEQYPLCPYRNLYHKGLEELEELVKSNKLHSVFDERPFPAPPVFYKKNTLRVSLFGILPFLKISSGENYRWLRIFGVRVLKIVRF